MSNWNIINAINSSNKFKYDTNNNFLIYSLINSFFCNSKRKINWKNTIQPTDSMKQCHIVHIIIPQYIKRNIYNL